MKLRSWSQLLKKSLMENFIFNFSTTLISLGTFKFCFSPTLNHYYYCLPAICGIMKKRKKSKVYYMFLFYFRKRYPDRNPKKIDFDMLHFFLNWDSLHAKLNSHYEAWSYKKKRSTKRLKHTGNQFRKNLQLKDIY